MADDGSGDAEAGQAIGAISPLLGAIPYVGPLLSAGGAIASGLFENAAAQKQKQQGASLRDQANQLQKEAVRPEFLQKLNYDQQTADGGLPGMELYKSWLAAQTANHLRAIKSSSPSGAASVNAISSALYGENDALNKLGMEDATFRSNARSTVSNDFEGLGTQQRGLELFKNQERDKMLAQANALETAGTGNKQTGINTITGAIGSTGANIFKNFSDPNYLKYLGVAGAGGTNGAGVNTGEVSQLTSGGYGGNWGTAVDGTW